MCTCVSLNINKSIAEITWAIINVSGSNELFFYNVELNDLRKIICLRKSEVYVKQKVSDVTEKLVEHGMVYTYMLLHK